MRKKMTEKEFRDFLETRPSLKNSKALVEEMITGTSPEFFIQEAKRKGGSLSVEQAEQMASITRQEIIVSISMKDSGLMTEKELLDHRIEKLPDDFSSN